MRDKPRSQSANSGLLNQQQEPELHRERPILFSAEMVRAILAGKKTQTRRVVVPKPDERYGAILWGSPRYDNGDGAKYFHTSTLSPSIMACWASACPFGWPGDRLYVRETHAIVPRTAYAHSDGVQQTLNPSDDHDAAIYREGWERSHGGLRWRPSIHMPRWASRITLEITGVRVERIREISVVDAVAEGRRCEHGFDYCTRGCGDPVQRYAHFWNLLNEKRGYSWDSNPWCWVIEFRVASQRGDQK